MGIDRFSVSGTDTIHRGEKTALASLIRTVGLIVGEESPATPDQFEEDLNGKLNLVEVNGRTLWDLSTDLTTVIEDQMVAWSPTSKKKFKEAKNSFRDFTKTPFSSSPRLERSVNGLNRDVLRSAAWEMLSTNYKLHGKSYHFTIDMPPSPNAALKLKREDKEDSCFLGLEFSAAVFEVFDPKQGELFALDKEGKLQAIDPGFTETLSEGSWQKICSIQLKVAIRFANIPNSMPEVTIEITVQSDCPTFRYIGGWALEILQLENVNLEPEKPLLANFSSSPDVAVEGKLIEDPLIELLEISNRSIGIMIEKLISVRNNSFTLNQLLSSILHLFNEVLKAYLLKEDSTYQYFNTKRISANSHNLKSALIDMLEAQGTAPKVLIPPIQQELSLIFYKLTDTQISHLLTVFHENTLSIIHQSALFVCQNPESFFKKKGYIVSANKLSNINYTIAIAIHSIRVALNNTKREKNIEMVGFDQTETFIRNIEEVPAIFQEYLAYLILSQSKNNPLRDLLLPYMPFFEPHLLPALESPFEEEGAGPSIQDTSAQPEYHLLHLQLPNPKKRLSCCPGGDPEKIAALWERNPVIKGLNDGSAIYFALSQLLTVYPNARIKALPYLTLVNITGGLVGMYIGTQAILHPKKFPNAFVRIWEATTQGLVVCVFSMGSAITIYLALHPENTHVSNLVFWTQIASVPIVLSGAHTLWHSIPLSVKERWFCANKLRYYTKRGLDVSAKFLLYAGAIDIALLKLAKLPQDLIYQIIPPVTALFLALGHLTPFRERLNLGMIYLTAIDFCYMLAETIFSEEISPEWSYTQLGFWILMLIPSIYFTLRNTINFIETYEQPPEMIVRASPKIWWDPEANPTINAQQYHSLRHLPALEDSREQAKLLTFARQIHDQNYGTTNPLPVLETTLEHSQPSRQRPRLGVRDWCAII